MDKVKDLDLYLLLGVDPDADETVIKKAYRKKALTCHPDKNPDNPKAAEIFHQLSEALAVLTDEKAKAAYDNLLKARKRREIEGRLLDSKRKKLKDDLEAREKAASYNRDEETLAGARLKAEIERLQKEGKKQMEEEQERFRQTFEQEKTSQTSFQVADYPKKVKLRWKVEPELPNEYDVEALKRIFCKYGDVGEVIIIEKKKGKGKFSSLVEMKSGQAAEMAVNIEKGFNENPFQKIELIDEESSKSNSHEPSYNPAGLQKAQEAKKAQKAFAGPGATNYEWMGKSGPQTYINEDYSEGPNNMNFNDFESLVMRNLSREEERKKIIEEMKRQDAEEND